MALKDLLQSQKTIRELKTETAALRLEKAEAARQKEQLEARAAAVSREADREAAGRQREQTEAVEAAQRALFEAMRPLLLALPTCALAAETAPLTLSTQQNAALLARDMIGMFAPVDDFVGALGLTVIGTVGEETPYDSARHDCPALLAPGTPVIVATVGYAKGEQIWVKARVKEVI